jgi:hypothetical protein
MRAAILARVSLATQVRAGSVRHRKPSVPRGHERSGSVSADASHRRSTATTSDGGAALDMGSNPQPPLARPYPRPSLQQARFCRRSAQLI